MCLYTQQPPQQQLLQFIYNKAECIGDYTSWYNTYDGDNYYCEDYYSWADTWCMSDPGSEAGSVNEGKFATEVCPQCEKCNVVRSLSVLESLQTEDAVVS